MQKVSTEFKANTGTPTARITVVSPTGSKIELGPSDIKQAAVSVSTTDTAGVSFGNTASRQANLQIQRSKLPRVYTNQSYHVEFGYVIQDKDNLLSADTNIMETTTDPYTGYLTTSYTWVRFADDANGTNVSDSPVGKKYVGIAWDKSVSGKSFKASDYTWGPIGTGIRQADDPTKYYTRVVFAKDVMGTNLSLAPTSETTCFGIDYDDTTATPSKTATDYTWFQFLTSDGTVNGAGVLSDATTAGNQYTWVKFADNASGSGMSDNPIGKKYVGIAWDKTTDKESTNAADYVWAAFGTGVLQPPTPRYTWFAYADNANGYNYVVNPTAGSTYIGVAFDQLTKDPTDLKAPGQYRWFLLDGNTTYGTKTEYISMGWFATSDTLCSETGTYASINAYDSLYWLKSTKETFGFQPRGVETTTRNMLDVIIHNDNAKHLTVKDVNELPNVRLKRFRPTNSVKNALGNVALAGMRNVLLDGDGYLRFVTPKSTGLTFNPGDYSNNDGLTLSTNNPRSVNTLSTTITKAFNPVPERDEAGNVIKDEENNCTYVDVEPVEETITKRASNVATDLTWSVDGDMFCDNGTVNVDNDKQAVTQITADLQNILSTGTSNKSFPAQNKGYTLKLFGGVYMEPFDMFDVVDVNGKTVKDLVAYTCSWTYNGDFETTLSATATTSDVETNTTLASVAGTVTNIGSQVLSLHSLTVNTISGQNATFNEMVADKLSANEAWIGDLTADIINTGQLTAGFLQVDVSNMNTATVENFYAKTGTFDEIQLDGETVVSGKLGNVTVTAENIAAGTIKADHLLLLGEDGLYHALNDTGDVADMMDAATKKVMGTEQYKNWETQKSTLDDLQKQYDDIDDQIDLLDPVTEAEQIAQLQAQQEEIAQQITDQEQVVSDAKDSYMETDEFLEANTFDSGLHGKNIIAESITADKLSVKDLSALNATLGGWVVDGQSIHTRNAGTTNARDSNVGTYLGADGYTRLDASSEDGVEFTVNNTVVASIKKPADDDVTTTKHGNVAKLTINNAEVTDALRFGKFAWVVRPSDNHTSLKILETE